MAQAELLPFPGIVDYLRQLCAQGRSGTVFLVSDDNRMAQVRLDNGQIASLLCRNRRGLEALGILRSMGHARLRFDESFMARGENDHLSNQVVFDNLSGAAVVAGVPPHVRAVVQRALTQYIGPMAEIVCDDHFDTTNDLAALVRLLAGEISAPAQAARFSAEMARELGLQA